MHIHDHAHLLSPEHLKPNLLQLHGTTMLIGEPVEPGKYRYSCPACRMRPYVAAAPAVWHACTSRAGKRPTITDMIGEGPGTRLHHMFRRLGIRVSANCNCLAIAREMNIRGPAWCIENADLLTSQMESEAKSRRFAKYLFSAAVVKRMILFAAKACLECQSHEPRQGE